MLKRVCFRPPLARLLQPGLQPVVVVREDGTVGVSHDDDGRAKRLTACGIKSRSRSPSSKVSPAVCVQSMHARGLPARRGHKNTIVLSGSCKLLLAALQLRSMRQLAANNDDDRWSYLNVRIRARAMRLLVVEAALLTPFLRPLAVVASYAPQRVHSVHHAHKNVTGFMVSLDPHRPKAIRGLRVRPSVQHGSQGHLLHCNHRAVADALA